jgi:hypothetical protein
MSVRDADAAWQEYAEDRAKVVSLMRGREKALPYIRVLPGFDEAKTVAYRQGAYFLPLVARTSEGMGGLVFAKTPTRNLPAALDPICKDITRTGQDVDRFAEQAFDAILQTHNVAVLVDYPETPTGMTKLVAEDRGIRPFLTMYGGDHILAARFNGEGDGRYLAHVRLLESVEEPDPVDEWKLVSVEQVRVLDLDEAGLYRQRIYRKSKAVDSAAWEQHGEDIEPRMNGARLSRLPIFFSTPRDGEPRPGIPPLRDIADINIAHLNDSAALQWALLWTANPTPIFKGLQIEPGGTVKLGSSEGLQVSVDGGAEFMEFKGAGLSEIRLALDAKRKDAALMGARLLLEDSKAAVAAETARIQRAGETSVVVGMANALSDCLTRALTFLAEWAGIGTTVADANGQATPLEYWLNPDINPAGLSAQELTALLAAWQAGGITLEDLFKALQRGEVIEATKSYADHVEQLEAEGGGLGTMGEAEDEAEQVDEPEAAEA